MAIKVAVGSSEVPIQDAWYERLTSPELGSDAQPMKWGLVGTWNDAAEREGERLRGNSTLFVRHRRATNDSVRVYDLRRDLDSSLPPQPHQTVEFARVIALRDIPEHNVQRGDFGGYVDLSLLATSTPEAVFADTGSCWLGDDAYLMSTIHPEVAAVEHEPDKQHRLGPDGRGHGVPIPAASMLSGDAFAGGDGSPGAMVLIASQLTDRATAIGSRVVIGSHAVVRGDASIEGRAVVQGSAVVTGNARVGDDAIVMGEARVDGEAQVFGHAVVDDHAVVTDHAQVEGEAQVIHRARLIEHAWVNTDTAVPFDRRTQMLRDWIDDGASSSDDKQAVIAHLAHGVDLWESAPSWDNLTVEGVRNTSLPVPPASNSTELDGLVISAPPVGTHVGGDAVIRGHAVVSGGLVGDHAVITDNAHVAEQAQCLGSFHATGEASVSGRAVCVDGAAESVVDGDACFTGGFVPAGVTFDPDNDDTDDEDVAAWRQRHADTAIHEDIDDSIYVPDIDTLRTLLNEQPMTAAERAVDGQGLCCGAPTASDVGRVERCTHQVSPDSRVCSAGHQPLFLPKAFARDNSY